ncbi:MAG: altronate dehydratase [Clostridiales bacterium]|nr:altronate dehydratase [Clostridiales bacterium]
MSKIMKIHPMDTVAVALDTLLPGEILQLDGEIRVRDTIKKGHKVALKPIRAGEEVLKYGYPIGRASCDIVPGTWVHTHNLRTGLEGLLDYEYRPCFEETEPAGEFTETFDGFMREDGQVGIRNDIWIINTVGCVNKLAETLARKANALFGERNTDGIYAFPHPHGCSQLGEDHRNTQRILKGLVHHPNAGGVLVLGLGCENNNIEEFKKILGSYNEDRVKFLNSQDVNDEVEEGLKLLGHLVEYAEGFERRPVPVSKLKVGLKCGGSDAFSGITANPLVGAFSDMLTLRGGTAVLTEVPEMFGAETILMNRCISREVFQKTVDMINNFKKYFMRYGQPIYENPSLGNKEGGITTLEEKSLGCIQKGGTGVVVDVLEYGAQAVKQGLNLLNGPGNDMVSVTALAAAGVHLVLFTTGRGTPMGGPVPTVKIATNNDLAERKKNWIDFNAGVLLEGKDLNVLKQELFEYVLDVASGRRKTQNEINDYREITIFKDGVTL